MSGARSSASDAVRPLIAAHIAVFPGAETDLLRRAYEVADRYHQGQMRKSGAPYITHPLAVAILLAEIGMDSTTLAAALLHDTVEDTDLTIGQVKAEFGPEVAILVEGVTKLDGSKWGDHAEAETFRKMIVAASIDLRVLVIKLADRVHNMRTLKHHPRKDKRERIARATLELLIPFAERLGLYVFLREMEDLTFAVLQPDAYENVRMRVRESAADRSSALGDLLSTMSAELAGAGLKAQVQARDRHLYSVYRDLPDGKLQPRNATRIVAVVDGTEADCYVALGALHARWRPFEPRFRDHIALPKNNMYRSLHTSLLTGDGEMVDVIIRNPAMDRVATLGVAAQIREAAGRTGHVTADVARRADLEWLERLLAWQPLAGSADFLDGMRADLRTDGIVVFTKDGTPVALPRGATAVDFAYAADPETAGAAVGMLVNGMRKSMENKVVHGQVVELVTGPALYPPDSWLEVARSGQAKAHIQQALARRDAENASAEGRATLAATLADRGADLLDLESDGTAFSVCRRLAYSDLEALYQGVATGDVTMDTLLSHLLPTPLAGS
ncbi:MAG TPA: HD domain-containing protein [Trebonia sp.]|nr:HD domain-containing protein [Trebonia sp.]